MSGTPPHRVRVAHPRTDAALRGSVGPARPEFDEPTAPGAVYLSALIRTQRRLAIGVCGIVAVILCGTAVLGAAAPRLAAVRWLGVPLPWLGLGLGIYPVLILIAVWAVRQAERNEKTFAELVRRREPRRTGPTS